MFHIDYRPSSLSEFVGNEKEIAELQKRIKKLPQTILISGPSGCGKTTLARIIAKELKCAPLYIKEIDTAQDRSIEIMRNLTKEAYSRPLIGKNKIYILDEAQQIRDDSQNALLKIAEEPPTNTYFVFCSTAPEKIIKTLKNRCYKINLNPLLDNEIASIIKDIAKKEKIEINKRIGMLILKEAKGIPREAVQLFEKLKDCKDVKEAEKLIKGFSEEDTEVYDLVKAIVSKDFNSMIDKLNNLPKTSYESIRIAVAKILKAFILKSDNGRKEELFNIYKHFIDSIDNNLGDINLLYKFWLISKGE